MKWTLFAAVGAVLFLVAGYAIAMAINLVPSATAGDWLGAGAGALGVGLTVLVAVGIEEWRSSAGARSDREQLKRALRELGDACIAAVENTQPWTGEPDIRPRAIIHQERLDEAFETYNFVSQRTVQTSVDLWRATRHLVPNMGPNWQTLRQELEAIRLGGENESRYNLNRERVTLVAGSTKLGVEHALQLLR